MGAGELRQWALIERLNVGPDGYGGTVGTWVTHFECPARFIRRAPIRSDTEREMAGGVIPAVMVTCKMRHCDETAAIDTSMRVKDGDTLSRFNVMAVQDLDGRREWIMLTLLENAPT